MVEWSRKRGPGDVPTPVATALSDFCRRAGSPASAAVVREALSCLSGEDDFRLRALAEGEPATSPLGPFAAVDVLLGTPAKVASVREETGYYQLVRELLAERERKVPEEHLAQAEPAAPPRPESEPRRRELPRPRGRFAQLPAAKRSLAELTAPDAGSMLGDLLEQHGHRFGLHRALAEQFEGRGGRPLVVEEVLAALERHGLTEKVTRKEHELVLSSYAEHKGSSGRAAWSLALSPIELSKLVEAVGAEREVEELRERFRREALAPTNLRHRLDLVGRTRYLADLGIERRFNQSLAIELGELLRAEKVEEAAKRHGLPRELLEKAAAKLKIQTR